MNIDQVSSLILDFYYTNNKDDDDDNNNSYGRVKARSGEVDLDAALNFYY